MLAYFVCLGEGSRIHEYDHHLQTRSGKLRLLKLRLLAYSVCLGEKPPAGYTGLMGIGYECLWDDGATAEI